MNDKKKPDGKPEMLDLSTLSEEELDEVMRQAMEGLPPVPDEVLDKKSDKLEQTSFTAKIARTLKDRGR